MFRASKLIVLVQDIRFGLRTALKNKGVTGLAVVCLAIGIGLNTMMFSVTDGVLIEPLPYHQPDRIVVLYLTQQAAGFSPGSAIRPTCSTPWRPSSRNPAARRPRSTPSA